MKSRHLLAALLLAATVVPCGAATRSEPQSIDRIVAVVNDDVITAVELRDRVRLITTQLARQGTAAPPAEALERQVLERMIMDRIQTQYARQTGLRVDDNQLDRALRRIAQENKLTMTQFQQVLEREGVDFSKFREEIRTEIILSGLKEREVDRKVTVSESEVEHYLTNRATQEASDEEFNVSHILLRVPEQAGPEQIQAVRARADEALQRLKKGADFAQMAALYSDAPDALQGGQLGWRGAARLPEQFVQALAELKPGETTPVLRSPNGFHIIKLLERRGGSGPTVVTQTRVRHILIKPSEVVSQADARHRLAGLKERLDNKADFAELARLHSEDASAASGGELGWVNPGDLVPEFERAMNALKPGEISGPVESPFGWHLIQVLERRQKDVSKEREQVSARQAIRARKADEAYQEWLRQLRDQAYVEYRVAQ